MANDQPLDEKLQDAERSIAELRAERDEAYLLVARMREHVTDAEAIIEQRIEGFDMQLDSDGNWSWAPAYDALATKYLDLRKKWNRLVPQFNRFVAPKQIGRPLAASDAQCANVRKLRKAGAKAVQAARGVDRVR